MIPTKYCKFTGCGYHPLETLEELDIGLCSRHSKEFNNSNYITLSCWSCDSLLDTVHKREMVEGVEIKDAYIFSKTCPKCDKIQMKNLQYVTVTNKPSSESTYSIDKTGRLMTQTRIVGRKRRQGVRTE